MRHGTHGDTSGVFRRGVQPLTDEGLWPGEPRDRNVPGAAEQISLGEPQVIIQCPGHEEPPVLPIHKPHPDPSVGVKEIDRGTDVLRRHGLDLDLESHALRHTRMRAVDLEGRQPERQQDIPGIEMLDCPRADRLRRRVQ